MLSCDKSNPILDANAVGISATVVKDEFRASNDMDQQFFAGYKPDFSLVVWKWDLPKTKRRNWLPEWMPKWLREEWESPIAPRDNSEAALRQWFISLLHPQGLLSQLEKFGSGRQKAADYSRYVRDAGRLLDYGNGEDKPKIPHVPPQKKFNLSEAVAALKDTREKLFPSFTPEETVAAIDPVGNREVQPQEGHVIRPVTNNVPPCSVALIGDKPMVFGVEKKRLAKMTRFAVHLLIDAYPDGLETHELLEKYSKKSGTKSGPARLLKKLRESDSDWQRAIIMPGSANTGGKYALVADE